MKNSPVYLLTACLAVMFTLPCCTQKTETKKITDIPVTTKSMAADSSFRQGLLALDLGDNNRARNYITKAIQQDPKLAIAYVIKTNFEQSAKDSRADMDSAKANLAGASNWEKWYYDYYETFLTSDWKKRLAVTQEIADSFPDAPRAQVDLGFTYSNGNNEAKARECYQKALSMDSTFVDAITALANSYEFIDPMDHQKGEMYASKLVQLAPSSPAAEILLGDCYRADNDFQKAKDTYIKAIALDSTNAAAYYKEGTANVFLGNYDDGRSAYKKGGYHDVSWLQANQLIEWSYLMQGDDKAGLKFIMKQVQDEDSTRESKSVQTSNKLNYLGDAELIAFHTGDAATLKQLMAMTEPISTQSGNDFGTTESKLNAEANNLYWQALLAALQGNYKDATAKAQQMKTTVEPITDPNKLNGYDFISGYIALKQKNYADAVKHFENGNPFTFYNKYYLAMAYDAAGNKNKADSVYKVINANHFIGVEYALIKNDVMKKVGSAGKKS